jgi:hypothetical protein
VVVGATHLAFGDLGGESREVAATDEPGDILRLVCSIPVIEVQNQWVSLTAVDAGMSQQMPVGQLLASIA